MGGLAAARVLSDHFDRVTILERDGLAAGAEPRRAVPQGRHAHALLGGGTRAISSLFPGFVEELAAGGGVLIDFNAGRWYQAGGYRTRNLVERSVISASRPFIEENLRRRTRALPNVTIETGVNVVGLICDGGRVRGVQLTQDDVPQSLDADFVVDCSGRTSSAAHWLQDIGYPAPEVVDVHCNVRYATLTLRRHPDDLDATFAIILESPPDGKRAAFVMPIEGDRWITTIAFGFGAEAPSDYDGFRAAAATLPSSELHDLLSRAEPLTDVVNHRLPSSRRKRFEKVKRVPAGFVALGDAICSFNPVYGQGMSSAVLQAVELGVVLDRGANDERLVRAFYKRAGKVIDNPWKLAVGADFAYPECTGPKPAGTDLVNRYLARALVAAQVSPEVNTQLILVQNLIAPPSSLLRPTFVLKVFRAAREAQRRPEARRPDASSRARTPTAV